MNRLLLPPPNTQNIDFYHYSYRPSKALDALLCSRTCCVPHTPQTGDDEALLTKASHHSNASEHLGGPTMPRIFFHHHLHNFIQVRTHTFSIVILYHGSFNFKFSILYPSLEIHMSTNKLLGFKYSFMLASVCLSLFEL